MQAAVDGACHRQVLDSGTVDVFEECGALVVDNVADCSCDGVSATVENSAERLLLLIARHDARHSGHIDVGGQFNIFTAITIAVVDMSDKFVPFVGLVDDEGVVLRTFLFVVPVRRVEDGSDVDISRRHAEGIAIGVVAAHANAVAVNSLDRNLLQRHVLRPSQSHRLCGASLFGICHDGTSSNVSARHGEGILNGIFVHVDVVVRDTGDVGSERTIVLKVAAVLIGQCAVLITHVLIVLRVCAGTRAIESDVVNFTAT